MAAGIREPNNMEHEKESMMAKASRDLSVDEVTATC
jgi:hypothetical protein